MVESELAPPRCSPLSAYAGRFAAASVDTGVRLRERPFLAMVDLRLGPDETAALDRIEPTIGLAVPRTPCTMTRRADTAVLWLGPEWWLVLGPPGSEDETVTELTAALESAHGSVVDVSAGRTMVELDGPDAHELLLTGCSLDLHPRAFPPGSCAQTLLARAPVLLARPPEEAGDRAITESRSAAVYQLLVRSSYASYLADWLLDATTGVRADL